MIYLVNFADINFSASQKYNSRTGKKYGGVDHVFEYSPTSIDPIFRKKYESIFNQSKGAGFWLWKPYIIQDALNKISPGDFLFYADSGSHFINSVEWLTNLTTTYQQDIIPFELELTESAWTKRDAFVLMNCDDQKFETTHQRLASFMLIKKSDFSKDFIAEYLNYCTDPRILTDLDNSCGKPNFKDFQAHRHDQSVFSLLTKKYSLQGFRDPSQWGNPFISEFKNSNYPQIIEHTRHKIPKHAKLTQKIKRFIKKLLIPNKL